MAFAEDFSIFFDADGFSVPAVITLSNAATRKIQVIFDNQVQAVDLLESNIAAATPQFTAKTSDLIGVNSGKRGDSVVIGSSNYKIERTEDDGTGISTVYLKKI